MKEVKILKKKILIIALIVAMLALPMSVAFAAKPDKFESFTFYGGPDMSAGPIIAEERDAGGSANHFVNWIWIGWKFSWTPTGSEVFATGSYSGNWVMHGYEPGDPVGTHTGLNANGVFNMTVTNWDGEEGYLIIRGVNNQNPSGKSGGKLTVLDGMIGDMKVHGKGTGTNIVPMLAWRYDFQLHFDP